MFQQTLVSIRWGALLTATLLSPSLFAGDSAVQSGKDANVQVEVLNPFTHTAFIPAGADLKTIRFEGIRMVSLPTTLKHTTDPNYCADAAVRDRGGSMFCPSSTPESFVQAYEATYSYMGQPVKSDDIGNRSFNFTVYFRPEELPSEARQAVAAKKFKRADFAGYFAISTDRATIQKTAIDKAQSKLCEGSFMDGSWTHEDRGCKDAIRYVTVSTPSDYVTVRVAPASKSAASAGVGNSSKK